MLNNRHISYTIFTLSIPINVEGSWSASSSPAHSPSIRYIRDNHFVDPYTPPYGTTSLQHQSRSPSPLLSNTVNHFRGEFRTRNAPCIQESFAAWYSGHESFAPCIQVITYMSNHTKSVFIHIRLSSKLSSNGITKRSWPSITTHTE